MSAAISVESLSVRFGGHTVLEGIDLKVAPGERVAILGPNGAGKTTLLDALGGQCTPSQGKISLAGDDITRLSPTTRFRHGLVRTFQHGGLVDELTAVENVSLADRCQKPALWQEALGLPSARNALAERKARAHRVLDAVDFSDTRERPIRELPELARRSIAIARLLVAQPRIVLLDEPTAGLAPSARRALLEPVLRLRPQPSVVLVEHDPNAIIELTDRAVVLASGRIAAHVPSEFLRDDPIFRELYPEAT